MTCGCIPQVQSCLGCVVESAAVANFVFWLACRGYRFHRKYSSQGQNNGGCRNDNRFHVISRNENFELKMRRTVTPKWRNRARPIEVNLMEGIRSLVRRLSSGVWEGASESARGSKEHEAPRMRLEKVAIHYCRIRLRQLIALC